MSTLSYEQLYQQILGELNELQQEDVAIGSQRLPETIKEKNTFYTQFFLALYVKYLTISRKLVVIYDTQLQPQKLGEVRMLLDSCLGRMLELKEALVKNSGDYILLDNVMLDLKLSPESLEPPVPSYILEDRKEEIQRQRNYIASLQEHYAESDPECLLSVAKKLKTWRKDPTKLPPTDSGAAPAAEGSAEEKAMPLVEAVKMLQICERGRQARQRAKFQLAIYKQQQYASTQGKEFQTLSGKDKAATVVQKVAKGFLEREKALERYKYEKVFLGMDPSEALLNSNEKQAAEIRARERKNRQKANVAELQKKTLEMESNLKAKEGPKTIENMLDEVLMHMAYARLEKKDGEVVEVPPPEEGGTLALLNRGGDDARRKSRRQSSIKRSSSARRSTVQSAGGKKGKDGEEAAEVSPASVHWDTMKAAADRYGNVWQGKFRESYIEGGDLNQAMDEEILRKQLLEGPLGVMSELRSCVDQLVMMEVGNLKERLAAEKKSKKKKAKKEKKPKKPKLKDPTKGVDIETTLNTCIFENVVQLVPSSSTLESFVGPSNIMASPLNNMLKEPNADEEIKKKWQKILRNWSDDVSTSLKMSKEAFEALYNEYCTQTSRLREPSALEIRTFIVENAILPLGSQIIHDVAPHTNSFLMYGFPNTGKTMMAFALANCSGSLFFNLSPGVFSSVKSIPKTIQLVFYLARMKAPSVIYIDNVEKVFAKKAGKKKDPLLARGKKMKKELVKAMNALLPSDRVLVVGVTNEPWLADSSLVQRFPKALYFPLPDYAARQQLLETFIQKKIGKEKAVIDPNTINILAMLTDSYSTGQLKEMVEETLTQHRIHRLLQQPLEASDFVDSLAKTKKPTKAEVDQMNTFYNTLPFALRRADADDFKETEEEAKKKKSAPKKKKKSTA